jgi:UDPglucose 6-dehydrogenase
MQLAVMGSDYVRLVAGASFADLVHDVVLVDHDQQKPAALSAGQIPIHQAFLPESLPRHRGSKLGFFDDLEQVVQTSDAIFVAFGAPFVKHGEADLSHVESLARSFSGKPAHGFSYDSLGRPDATPEKRPTSASAAVMNYNRS